MNWLPFVDGEGRVSFSNSQVPEGAPFLAGVANDGDAIYATLVASGNYVNSLQVDGDGALCVIAGAPIARYVAGFPVDASGRIVVDQGPFQAADVFHNAVRIGHDGIYGVGLSLTALHAEISPDGNFVIVTFSSCAALHPLHAGVEYQVDGGAWTPIPGEMSAGTGTEHSFPLLLQASAGQEYRWRYVSGQASPGLFDCDTLEEMNSVEIPVENSLVLEGDYLLLETGTIDVILLENATLDPEDGVALENAP